jgi:type I pantothenate kinase
VSAWLDRLSAEVEARRASSPDRPFVIGLTGGVASGKSTVARRLAERLTDDGLSVEVVTTDGFLLSNAVLTERGLMERKGFPDSYDWNVLTGFLAAVAVGEQTFVVPTYSHEAYDVGATRVFARPHVLILEGLEALDARVAPLDLAIYLHADEGDLIAWYTERFMALGRWTAPRLAERFAAAGSPEALARDIWDRINAPVLREHVLPARARADIVLDKARDHSVRLAN